MRLASYIARTATWIPASVIGLLFLPMAVTRRTFGPDWTLHLWAIRQQQWNIKTMGHPGLFVSAKPLGAFYPLFAFVGSGIYSVGGYLAIVLGDNPLAAYKLLSLAGLFGLTRVAAMDLQRAAITVNAVAPFARTRVTDIIQPANEAQKTYKERALKIGAHHVANLVTALCSPAGKGITGQLLGVRGREVFLFGQPRPVAKIDARLEAGGPAALAQDLSAKLSDKFTDLTTDLEAFNTEPLV